MNVKEWESFEAVVMQREGLRTALTDLLATCNRHRWRVNSDETDTIHAATYALLHTPWKPLKAPNNQ